MTENKLFPFPGVQLVKCSVIVNDAEEAADCEKERGMGRVSLISRVKLSRFVFQA